MIRHFFSGIEAFFDLRMRGIARNDHRAGQGQPCLDLATAQDFLNLGHRPVQVDLDDFVGKIGRLDVRHVFRRVHLKLFDEHAVLGDFAKCLAVGRA